MPFLFPGIPSPAQWELSGIEPWGSSKASPCDGPKAKGRALGKHSQDQGRPGALLAAIRADAGQTCSDAGHRDRGCRRRLSAQPKSGCASGKCPPTPMPPCPLRCQPQGARCTESTTHMGTGRAGLQGGCLLAGSMMETPWSRACAPWQEPPTGIRLLQLRIQTAAVVAAVGIRGALGQQWVCISLAQCWESP